ncbi:MAG TPA: Asp-tRNA(Asn)/Glu-tRNA(Gln) amidotransferase subunit GatC [Nitrososphaera sp.]|nr:Asp-tRNA(Asn)/Glu-tRNA(Gln) amidotransferase subunit GatC [Nitrososphaera sp.]
MTGKEEATAKTKKVTKEEVKHLGWLSRIELSDEELDKYASQIEQIIAYLDTLDTVPLEKIEVIKPKIKFSNLRDDAEHVVSSADTLGTKYRKDGFVKGPRMV